MRKYYLRMLSNRVTMYLGSDHYHINGIGWMSIMGNVRSWGNAFRRRTSKQRSYTRERLTQEVTHIMGRSTCNEEDLTL